ncbi:MAG: hypothetical protein IJ060_08360, partial [Oscillospiraceae bacterium]|nr:hypothetical protein [Oscillospiraceae bacterium]
LLGACFAKRNCAVCKQTCDSPAASFSYNLTKDLTAHLHHQLCAVLPLLADLFEEHAERSGVSIFFGLIVLPLISAAALFLLYRCFRKRAAPRC